jgi:hypothetical protein
MSMATATLLTPADDGWADALTRVRHDVYHLPEYVRLDAGLSGGTPAAVRYDDGGHVLLLPLVVRPVPGTDGYDAASPYGYPGPVSDTADAGFWARACRAVTGLLDDEGVISAFVRLHPLLSAPVEALRGAGAVVRHGETVSVDLSLTPEQMWHETHRTHRNQINKAKRAGVSIVMDDWDRFDAWIATYHANMRRVGATDFYFFTTEHFHALRAALGDRVHLAVALDGDDLLGGNLFFEYAGMMHTHLQATRDGRIHYADKLLYDEIRRWGRERGNAVFHIGGGLGGAADSLFAYKAAFAAGRHEYHTWRVVTDPQTFEKLAGAPTPEVLAGRFPPYR